MSNAKIAQMIAEAQRQARVEFETLLVAFIADANRQLIEDIDKILSPIIKDLAQTRADLEQLQSAIAPMATELERLRRRV